MNLVLTVLQALAVVAVLAGGAILLPLGAALVVDGLIVLAVATAAEHIVSGRRSAPSVRRSGPNAEEVA
ncbi:hypothetical protein [Pseudonocardia broussonetiae]|uniref:Uncharacterized protein n=1 Tax=Pseudonocardia broussonetiae TaxID=2736640 RepID=A0A6M6JUY2_9PSEU|nr:hypothetical protein [Pseudonocardia broussonetiae]QJY51225.1 hypothetical protein HOP40_35170 [Pseudonocardia broussonetiae]